jgi:hypothetical protein
MPAPRSTNLAKFLLTQLWTLDPHQNWAEKQPSNPLRLLASIVILDADEIVRAEIRAGLHLD